MLFLLAKSRFPIPHTDRHQLMLLFAEIANCLQSKQNVAQALDDLGTWLRDKDVRADPQVSSLIPSVLLQFDAEQALVLRVLVNYCADNDSNREKMVSEDKFIDRFWDDAFSLLEYSTVGALVVVLLTQFTLNIDDHKKTAMLLYFAKSTYIAQLVAYCNLCEQNHAWDELELSLELLVEYSSHDPLKFSVSDAEIMLRIGKAAVHCGDEDCDVLLLHASQVTYNITNVHEITDVDSCKHALVSNTYDLMNEIPLQLTNIAHIKRNWFASCGNISTLAGYDNFQDIEGNLGAILNPNSDLYVAAAAAILVGNCVSSRESQQAVLKKISETSSLELVVDSVLQRNFGDVVQYQFLHLFNNLMTTKTADAVLVEKNYIHLLRITKVVVDNCKYYKEIGGVYVKFLRKLLSFGFAGSRDPFHYKEMWAYIGNAESDSGLGEIDMLLLQAVATSASARQNLDSNTEILERILSETLRVSGSVDGNVLLLKLKTLAVLFQNIPCKDLEATLGTARFVSVVAKPFHQFLSQVSESTNGETNPQAGAIANNTKFVAAVASGHFALLESADPSYGHIVEICSAVVAR